MRDKVSKSRLEQLLAQDKEDMNEASRSEALAEFVRVASEYFDIVGSPALTVKRIKGSYEVNLAFHAARVKNFSVLQ